MPTLTPTLIADLIFLAWRDGTTTDTDTGVTVDYDPRTEEYPEQWTVTVPCDATDKMLAAMAAVEANLPVQVTFTDVRVVNEHQQWTFTG